MKTVEQDEEKQVPHRRFAPVRNDNELSSMTNEAMTDETRTDETTIDETGSWARVCATAGAAAWAAIAVLARLGIARIGAIELLFLFAPLVIVPLGMELVRLIAGTTRLLQVVRPLQPFGAAMAAAAVCMPPGLKAGIVAAGWMVVCATAALDGLLQLVALARGVAGKSARATPIVGTSKTVEIAIAMAKIDLAVGGAWLVASRLGMHPVGIQEPIGLLTAVHFHFAGFATALIAAATLKFAEGLIPPRLAKEPLDKGGATTNLIPPLSPRTRQGWGTQSMALLKAIVMLVIGMPLVVAAGFVISPALKMGAAVVFSVSVAALAVMLSAYARKASDSAARVLLQVAAGAVFAGMIFAAAYAVADFVGSDALPIPQMASTHGLLNAFGFCMTGLLGWLVENSCRGSEARDR